MRKGLFIISLLCVVVCKAQTSDLIFVKLDQWAKHDQFEKLVATMPFFLISTDTIETMDFENLREAKKIRITKPEGFRTYAYGYIFFNGVPNPQNPGYVSVLMVNLADRNPQLFVDYNNNYNFTDDGESIKVPMPFNRKDTSTIVLSRSDNPNAQIAIQLSRMNFLNKYEYKKLLNEYYEIYYKNRTFAGIEYCFREQRFVSRSGIVRLADDSFRIALYDANSNGLYNDIDTDRIITANYPDTIFDTKDDLRGMTIPKKKEDLIIEKNGLQFEILQIDPAGQYMTLKALPVQNSGRLVPGKKAPSFTYVDWEGKKNKLKKLKKYNVYIYYSGPYAKNFAADTATLRIIADEFKDCVKVIGFIDMNKSYELRIFGTYSNLNWIAAFKDKYVTRQLQIRGVPSSLWLGKKRKVKQYNLTPQQMLEELRKIDKS
jgi:hypothetical protein